MATVSPRLLLSMEQSCVDRMTMDACCQSQASGAELHCTVLSLGDVH
jgi:hypothetical protein